jgi:hypothetical protein
LDLNSGIPAPITFPVTGFDHPLDAKKSFDASLAFSAKSAPIPCVSSGAKTCLPETATFVESCDAEGPSRSRKIPEQRVKRAFLGCRPSPVK